MLPAISSWPNWINFRSSPNQKQDQIWTTLFPVCLLWAVWVFGIPFPRKFSRCSIYYAQAAKNLREDNTWMEKKTLCWPDSPFSHRRENFMNSLGKDKAFSSLTRPLILWIPVKSPEYIPAHVLTPRGKKQSLLQPPATLEVRSQYSKGFGASRRIGSGKHGRWKQIDACRQVFELHRHLLRRTYVPARFCCNSSPQQLIQRISALTGKECPFHKQN